MATITFENVSKKFGSNEVLKNLSLVVQDGECFTLLGPSGCGKTVLLRLLAGFDVPDSGRILIDDVVVADPATNTDIPPDQRGLGVVFQDYAVWPHMTVFDNIAYPLKLKNIEKEALHKQVMEVVELVNLTGLEERLPSQLSGGQQQRVALARALVAKPSLMLLDEPLNNLDANLREEMRFEIKALQKKFEFSIIYVTHDQSEAMALSDRIMVMKKGAVQQIDTPLNIYNNPANKFVFNFIGLSNQLNVNLSSQGIHIDKVDGIFNLPEMPNNDLLSQGKAILASRPSDIEFVQQGGIPGVVKRRSYLGEVTDYSIQVGDQDIRVQIGRDSGPKEGETCQIAFEHLHWYPAE